MKEEYKKIIADEVNVHEVVVDTTLLKNEIVLDTTITPELKAEGHLRDIIRQVQELRKKHGLAPEDKIILVIDGDAELVKLVYAREEQFAQKANVRSLAIGATPRSVEFNFGGAFLSLGILIFAEFERQFDVQCEEAPSTPSVDCTTHDHAGPHGDFSGSTNEDR